MSKSKILPDFDDGRDFSYRELCASSLGASIVDELDSYLFHCNVDSRAFISFYTALYTLISLTEFNCILKNHEKE